VTADFLINRTVIHAGTTTNATQHRLKIPTYQSASATVDQNHIVVFGTIKLTRSTGTGKNRKVIRD
jgi:hypothetical protein